VVVPMVKGEPLLQKKLSEKGFRGIEPAIQDGMRAVTVLTTNMAAGVAGFVLPGSKVDVILTLTDAGNTASTFVLLENVEVLASQQFVAPPNEKLNVGDLQCVTLLVTKEQSMKVALAQSRGGNLQLVLRNP
jgi:pilus assembly protein CpaB